MSSAELKKLYIEQCGALGKNAENPVAAVVEMLNNVAMSDGEELSKKIAGTITPSVWKWNTVSFVVLVYNGLLGDRSIHIKYVKNILMQLETGIPRAREIYRFLAHIIARYGEYFSGTCGLDFIEVTPLERTYIANELYVECDRIIETDDTRKIIVDKISEYVGNVNKTVSADMLLIAENKVITANCLKLTAENEKLVDENKKLTEENKKLTSEGKAYYRAVCKTNDDFNKLDDAMRERDAEVSKLNREITKLTVKTSELTLENEKIRSGCLTGLAHQGNELIAANKKYKELASESSAKIAELEKLNKNLNHRLNSVYEVLKNNQDT